MEDAKLIVTETQPGLRGSMRVCVASVQSIHLDAAITEANQEHYTISNEMPVGNYFSCQVEPTCGLADWPYPVWLAEVDLHPANWLLSG